MWRQASNNLTNWPRHLDFVSTLLGLFSSSQAAMSQCWNCRPSADYLLHLAFQAGEMLTRSKASLRQQVPAARVVRISTFYV